MKDLNYKIIENTDKARDDFGWNYGGQHLELEKEIIEEILEGKCLAISINEDEYSEFISVKHTK